MKGARLSSYSCLSFRSLLLYFLSPRLLRSRSCTDQGSPASTAFGLLFPGLPVDGLAFQIVLEEVLSSLSFSGPFSVTSLSGACWRPSRRGDPSVADS